MVHASVVEFQLGHDTIDRGGGRRINSAGPWRLFTELT
jgi:hypothetical protein